MLDDGMTIICIHDLSIKSYGERENKNVYKITKLDDKNTTYINNVHRIEIEFRSSTNIKK